MPTSAFAFASKACSSHLHVDFLRQVLVSNFRVADFDSDIRVAIAHIADQERVWTKL